MRIECTLDLWSPNTDVPSASWILSLQKIWCRFSYTNCLKSLSHSHGLLSKYIDYTNYILDSDFPISLSFGKKIYKLENAIPFHRFTLIPFFHSISYCKYRSRNEKRQTICGDCLMGMTRRAIKFVLKSLFFNICKNFGTFVQLSKCKYFFFWRFQSQVVNK